MIKNIIIFGLIVIIAYLTHTLWPITIWTINTVTNIFFWAFAIIVVILVATVAAECLKYLRDKD